eukprot:Skav200514  [mRNA]  locus=scaffold450:492562:495352:- [translate_table: standard]
MPCPVRFGDALHRVFPEVQQLEDWAKNLLGELAQKASQVEDATSREVFPGASVRIHSLESALGAKLNGCEGVVESWNAATCRWQVRISAVGLKAIRDENLEPLHPGTKGPEARETRSSDTISIYRLLCHDGVTAVHETDFQGVVQRLLPQSQEQIKKFLWLLPKCPDGKVDVPEALAQLERGFDQTLQAGNVPVGGVTKTPAVPKLMPTLSPGPPMAGRQRPHPGAPIPSPVASHQRQGPAPGAHAKGEAVLLRFSQHLLGKPRAPGPGVDVLRLFARNPDVVTLEEVMEAVSVLPLGISRAEVQAVFAQVRGCGTGTLPLSQLTTAAEASCSAGVPFEAGQIDAKRLGPALQRLGTRASPQEFRVALMQAEPYMTHNQMEWLSELTDKDCEGRLLPPSLLPRLGIGASRAEPLSWNTVPPRPPAKGTRSVAHSLPQLLVLATLLYRIRQRLFIGSQLTLGSLLGLFDIADGSNRELAQSAVISRDLLGSLLGHLRLSISVAEADELLTAIAATAGKRSGDSGCIQIALLYDMVDRAGQPEMETVVLELRDAVRQRLWSKASCFSSVAGSAELLSEPDFRRALKAAMAEAWAMPGSLPEDDEDRVVLLAEKDAEGRVLWRNFVQSFCGGIELDQMSEITKEEEPPVPASPNKGRSSRTPGGLQVGTASVNGAAAMSQQSWRSQKAAKMEGRSAVSSKGQVDAPLSPQSPKRGCRCFRRRSL